MSKNEVKLKPAKNWAKNWQQKYKKECKAFLMPAIDLIEALEEMNVLVKQKDGHYSIQNVDSSGVRAYMAIDEDIQEGRGEKLLIVGTKVDCNGIHRDIIEGEKPSGCDACEVDATVAELEGSGIFDFTAPCPTTCDDKSPLYDPS